MVHMHIRVGILKSPVGFDPSGPFEWGCWAKSDGTHNMHYPKRKNKSFSNSSGNRPYLPSQLKNVFF